MSNAEEPGKAPAVKMSSKLEKIYRRLERNLQESKELDELQEGLDLLTRVVLRGSVPAASTTQGKNILAMPPTFSFFCCSICGVDFEMADSLLCHDRDELHADANFDEISLFRCQLCESCPFSDLDAFVSHCSFAHGLDDNCDLFVDKGLVVQMYTDDPAALLNKIRLQGNDLLLPESQTHQWPEAVAPKQPELKKPEVVSSPKNTKKSGRPRKSEQQPGSDVTPSGSAVTSLKSTVTSSGSAVASSGSAMASSKSAVTSSELAITSAARKLIASQTQTRRTSAVRTGFILKTRSGVFSRISLKAVDGKERLEPGLKPSTRIILNCPTGIAKAATNKSVICLDQAKLSGAFKSSRFIPLTSFIPVNTASLEKDLPTAEANNATKAPKGLPSLVTNPAIKAPLSLSKVSQESVEKKAKLVDVVAPLKPRLSSAGIESCAALKVDNPKHPPLKFSKGPGMDIAAARLPLSKSNLKSKQMLKPVTTAKQIYPAAKQPKPPVALLRPPICPSIPAKKPFIALAKPASKIFQAPFPTMAVSSARSSFSPPLKLNPNPGSSHPASGESNAQASGPMKPPGQASESDVYRLNKIITVTIIPRKA